MKTLGEQITVLRSDRNMTQEDLAEKIGVSRQAVTKWEANESTPELAKIIALADFFGISLDKLVGRDESLYDMVKDTVIECSANCRELYDGEYFYTFPKSLYSVYGENKRLTGADCKWHYVLAHWRLL